MENRKRLLIVDDDSNLVEMLRASFARYDYEIYTALDGSEAEKQFGERDLDAVILDVMLPVRDGFSLCRDYRSKSNVPIILLTARTETENVIRGLESGADDYMKKPFEVRELVARIQALIARVERIRAAETESRVKNLGDVSLDLDRQVVSVRSVEIPLTPTEMSLLYYLMMNAGRLVDRESLLRQVWGYDFFGKTNLVDVAIRRLREKIEPNPSEPVYLLTVRGQGYRFAAMAAPSHQPAA